MGGGNVPTSNIVAYASTHTWTLRLLCIYRKFNFMVRFINATEKKYGDCKCAVVAVLDKCAQCNRRPCLIRSVHHLHNKLFNWILYFKLFFLSPSLSLPRSFGWKTLLAWTLQRNDNQKNDNIARMHGLLGDIILHTTLAMEIMGRWKNSCANARFGHWHLLGN